MNVYDFDKTIYHKDSTVEFYKFELKRHPYIVIMWPIQLYGFILYGLKLITLTQMKSYFYSYFRLLKDIDKDIKDFWDKEIINIHKWYYDLRQDSDLVITASPQLYVEEACRRLNVKCIGSQVDKKTGKTLSENCNKNQKVIEMRNHGYNTDEINEFYSDSYNDRFLAVLARKAYMIVDGQITDWIDKEQ